MNRVKIDVVIIYYSCHGNITLKHALDENGIIGDQKFCSVIRPPPPWHLSIYFSLLNEKSYLY